jgi:YD repeat-containing protein
MKGILLICLLAVTGNTLQAQYYYNDLVAPVQSARQYKLYIANNVTKITGTSADAAGNLNDEALLQVSVDADKGTTTTTGSDANAGKSITINTFKNNKLQQTDDSSGNVRTITRYQYDAQGRVSGIESTTSDAFMETTTTEQHLYTYDEHNLPRKMLRISGTDTTQVFFIPDSTGNISEEHWKRRNSFVEDYYYYYNTKKQLTDIVRYNAFVKRMLPDLIFDYDNKGRLIKTIEMPGYKREQYFIFLYEYNEAGLKVKDLLHDRHNKLLGTVHYTYK